MKLKADNRQLRRKLGALDRNTPAASAAALKGVMGGAMDEIIRGTPVDTARLKAGYAQAANAAGLGPFPVPAIKESKNYGAAVDKLTDQLAFWQRIVDRYEREGRTDKWYRRAVRTRDQAAAQLAKLTKTSVVVGLFANAGGPGRRLKTTVRDKVYGGTGEFRMVGGMPFYRIHNREFHATFVERGQKGNSRGNYVVKTALTKARAFGVRRHRGKFLDTVTAGTGVKKGR